MEYYHSKYGSPVKGKKSKFHKFIIYALILLILVAIGAGYLLYSVIYKTNVWTGEKESVSLYIPTASNYDDVKHLLYTQGIIIHRNSFEWLAKKKKYPQNIKPGRYIITSEMSNNELINLLRLGEQTPVKVIFNNVRDIEQLAQKVSLQIEADSATIVRLLFDSSYIAGFGVNRKTVTTIFIPNTYEFWWTTGAAGFIERMYEEYQLFWNDERRAKAVELKMTIPEVVTLASIIQKETNKNDEKATIAGVYINRMNKGWKLQADPTLVYAWGDFNINRILKIHQKIDSPYNTYKYTGLPPGPICIPSIASIGAVLNHENHNYMFFCAKADMSGYHVFAKTNTQHNKNAREYQKALDERRIMK